MVILKLVRLLFMLSMIKEHIVAVWVLKVFQRDRKIYK